MRISKIFYDEKRWEKYKELFNLKFVMYLVTWFAIVPLLANLLNNVPDEILITSTIPHLVIALDIPFSWKLLWFSSLCFFIAYVLYLIRVPEFIKDNNNYIEYKGYGHSPRNLVWKSIPIVKTDKFIERMLEKKYITIIEENEYTNIVEKTNPNVTDDSTIYAWQYNEEYYKFAMPITNGNGPKDDTHGDISEKEVFWEIFGRFSEQHAKSRILISILLRLSLLLFSIVLLQHIDAGLDYVLGDIWTSWNLCKPCPTWLTNMYNTLIS